MSASAEEVSGEALPPEAGASALLPYPDDTAPPAPLVDETSAELALLSEESPSDKRAAAETGELSHEKTDLANAAFGYELGEKTTELRAETDSSDASPQDVYFDADKRLRRYTVDDELMAILQTEPRLNLITGDANTIIRVNYDEHGRLLTRTVWEVPFESAADTLNTEEKIKSTADMPETTEKTEPVAATSESSEKTKKMEPAAADTSESSAEPAGKAKPASDILELAEESTTDVLKSPAESATEETKPAAETPDDTSAEGLVCKSITEYRYDGDSPRAVSKTHRVPAEQRLEETRYRPSGDTESVAVYRESDEQQKASSREDFTYDAENRLVEKISQIFDEQGKAVTERVQYRYTGKAAEPDCERYHDGKLKFKLIHESETAYAEIRYLAYGLSVQTYYRDNRKALEFYLRDGKEVRRQQF
ncbi:hypothetical protein [Treponema endosymbiont of Eucomonympha sp.]|uniref:hypothetical protein n=1 Tax=Treponema endosymbiont of Eucomonympha sp. TaxID=1580831 RepID=UPI001396B21D|nr:hypothetical protein [Treponema endosymbiont of Eucomonympha sp.]